MLGSAEKMAQAAVGVQDAHRRDVDGQRRVVVEELGEALLLLVRVCAAASVLLGLQALLLGRVRLGLVLELFEDLHAR